MNYRPDDEVEMPSWISGLSRAPFGMNEHLRAGLRMERMNANPLVGTPGSNEIPYRAAETREINKEVLKFIQRSQHYSILVHEFALDVIQTMHELSRLGSIPHRSKLLDGLTRRRIPPEDF